MGKNRTENGDKWEALTIYFWPALQGDRQAQEILLANEEIRKYARNRMGRMGIARDEGVTAIVSEAFARLKLRDGEPCASPKVPLWVNRSHFYGFMALVIQRVIADMVKAKVRRSKVALESTLHPTDEDVDSSPLDVAPDRQARGLLTPNSLLTLAEALEDLDRTFAAKHPAQPLTDVSLEKLPGLAESGSAADRTDKVDRDAIRESADANVIHPRKSLVAQVWDMSFFLGCTFKEIAEAVQLGEKTVWLKYRFARGYLRERLKDAFATLGAMDAPEDES